MTVLRSQESLLKFYTEALAIGENTANNLQAPVEPAFTEALNSVTLAACNRTALDIGYGAGSYSIALAQSDFQVKAIDRVPAAIFAARLPRTEWAHHIEVVTSRIEDYPIRAPLGVMVAKDVLHYLSRRNVNTVLTAAIAASVPGSFHYLQVFTSISRTTNSGEAVRFDGEFDCSTAEFITTLRRLYRRWGMTLTTSAHTERDRRTGRPHFQATRVTAIARRPPP